MSAGTSKAAGSFDFRFALFDSQSGSNQIGGPVTLTNVAVTNGLFAVVLDFGTSNFTGTALWLNIGVCSNGTGEQFVTLYPRQQITAAPFAVYALNTSENVLTVTNITNITVTNIVNVYATNSLMTNVTLLNTLSSNGTFNSMALAPTNIYNSNDPRHPTFTASYSPFSSYITLSAPPLSLGLHRGDNILFGNAQFTIVGITNANKTVGVLEGKNANFSSNNVVVTVYPNAAYNEDINGNPAGFIANDGSVGIIGDQEESNSGRLIFCDGQNSMVLQTYADQFGNALSAYDVDFGSFGNQFRVYSHVVYDTLLVMPDNTYGGKIATRAITNNQGGTVPFLTSPEFKVAPTWDKTNAVPSNVTVGTTPPDIWLTVTNNGIAYSVPGYRNH